MVNNLGTLTGATNINIALPKTYVWLGHSALCYFMLAPYKYSHLLTKQSTLLTTLHRGVYSLSGFLYTSTGSTGLQPTNFYRVSVRRVYHGKTVK